MGAAQNKVTYLDKSPVDLSLLYQKITGDQLEQVAENEWHGKCLLPGHEDTKASAHYNLTKGVFHCKVCDVGMGAVELVRQHYGLDDKAAAIKWLKEQKFIQEKNPAASWEHVDVTYDYVDEDGSLLLQVGRWNNPKHFGQRIPDHKGGWKYTLKDLKRRVPFMLPELLRAVGRGETVYVVEGEKDALNLMALGFCATTNPQGAKWKWPVEWADFFDGAERVVVIADNDEPGRQGAHQRASIIARKAKEVFVIERLPGVDEKGDVSDWLKLPGAGYDALEQIVASDGIPVQAYVAPYPLEAVSALLEDFSDTGNGQWLNACLGQDYRYILDSQKWYRFDGKRWVAPVNEVAVTEQVVNLMLRAYQDYDGPSSAEFQEHIRRSRSYGARKNMLVCAQGPLGRRSEEFDGKPFLFNCDNGTLDLATGELRPFNRDDLLTLISKVSYDVTADCPRFKAWLMDCCNGSQELYDYMQMVMGSCLEARSGTRRFYFIFGPKGTGKSTFIRTLEKLLGQYQCATDFKVLTESKFSDGNGPSPALARLKGMRMVTASESRDNDRLDVARIKQLIGGDSITARHLNANMEEFRFEATLILSGNEMPRIQGDESIWDKFKPVPFVHQIGSEDPHFEERVIEPEMPGILRFAVEGLLRLRRQEYRTQDPKEVVEARSSERDLQDPFAEWFTEQMELAPTKTSCDQVFDNYTAWCAKNKMYAFKRQKLTRWLNEKQSVSVQQSNVNKWYVGIKPKFVTNAPNDTPGF